MTNLERLRRQTMGTNEAAQAAEEIIRMRADLLKVGRLARLQGYDDILNVESVNDMLVVVGMGR